MRTLYIDCGMGAAGDMLTAALLELLPDPAAFVRELNGLGLPRVTWRLERTVKCGVTGSRVSVTIQGHEEGEDRDAGHDHHHHHHTMADIAAVVRALPVSEKVKGNALAVYERIARAESEVHGVAVEEVHFHEVGAMDAVADVLAVCLLMERLAPERVIASPVHVGCGSVRCAHGILPVPAPATALLLKHVPIYSGEVQGELCTPTGAALLVRFADSFGPMPVMRGGAIGYGMGKKDFPRANCVRALLGETEETGDAVAELRCDLDDMTGEALGFAMERLLEAGALDVFTAPVGMKKSRPGVELTVLCRPEDREAMVELIFRHTTTLGVRETMCRRYTLRRRVETADTPWGPVGKKISQGYGVTREKLEYEDLARIARQEGVPLARAAALAEEKPT